RRWPETLGEARLADRPGEGARPRRVRARTPVVVDVGVAGASPSPKRRALRVRSVCPCIFRTGGHTVDVSMMLRLLSALDHAAHVVVGADATVDWWPRYERSGCQCRDWRAAHIGLQHQWARCTSDGTRPRRLAPPAGHEAAAWRRCREE